MSAPAGLSARERISSLWEAARSNFGFLAGVGMFLGVVAGFTLPTLDDALELDLPVLDFIDRDVARGLLETVATATVSVTGLAFSVTIVAFTLASSQLSPRVLRTFSGDRLSQVTLACFLGTFAYCLAVLIRLGTGALEGTVPNLSVTLAVVLAFVSFGLFVAFIAHIVRMLQPSSIIAGIASTGRGVLASPYPAGVGGEGDGDGVAALAGAGDAVRATSDGYVATFVASRAVAAATACDGLVVQRTRVGEYVWPGVVLAEVRCRTEGDREQLADAVRGAFVLGSQRTPVQDPGFPIRQLADIALKGLSPSVNDPTTAENAMEAMTSLLTRAAGADVPSPVRTDDAGGVRLVAAVPGLDDLVRLGFEQVRTAAAGQPVLERRLLVLLAAIETAAAEAGRTCPEAAHQAALITAQQRAPA